MQTAITVTEEKNGWEQGWLLFVTFGGSRALPHVDLDLQPHSSFIMVLAAVLSFQQASTGTFSRQAPLVKGILLSQLKFGFLMFPWGFWHLDW